MPKDILIKLASVKYSGKSIGDDIRIEIETVGEFFGINKQIKYGTTKQINKEIAKFTVDQPSFSLPIVIRIIEKDWVHNDVGSTSVKLKVDLSVSTPQVSTHRISVIEKRWKYKHPEAIFDVKLEVQAIDAIRYIRETDQGFVKVVMDDDSKESLPAFLKVRYERREANRDYFTILEGILQERKGSVKLDKDGSSFLQSENEHTGSVHMVYSLSKNKFKVKGKSYKVVSHPSNSWKKGFYDIEIPDHSHKLGRPYLDRASKAMTWFHIGHDPNDERYLHTGSQTAGCITLNEIEKWDEVYNILIRARKGDFKSIGTLEVID